MNITALSDIFRVTVVDNCLHDNITLNLTDPVVKGLIFENSTFETSPNFPMIHYNGDISDGLPLFDIELFTVFQQTANQLYCGFTNFRIDSVVNNITGAEVANQDRLYKIFNNGTFRILDFSSTYSNYSISISVFNNDTSFGMASPDAASKWSNGTTNSPLIDVSLYSSINQWTPPNAPVFTEFESVVYIDVGLSNNEDLVQVDLSNVLSMADLSYEVSVSVPSYEERYVTYYEDRKEIVIRIDRI